MTDGAGSRLRFTDSSDVARIRRASWAFTTRRVAQSAAYGLLRPPLVPRTGDLVLARVDALGHHRVLQLANGRRKNLFAGDEVVVAYGNRYASSQFEAIVPETLGPCHLAAGGGLASKAVSWHERITRGPTAISPIGLLCGPGGGRINLADHALTPMTSLPATPPVTIAVVGTAMDSGKTQCCAFLAKGLSLARLRVGYAKVTGTGAGGDTWLLTDAGAEPVLDFTDAGMASTYLASDRQIRDIMTTLMGHLMMAQVDAIILEIADGVLQRETSTLLASGFFRDSVAGIFLAARDAMGAVAGATSLRANGLPIVGLGGVLTASPLQRDEAQAATGQSSYTREELASPANAMEIFRRAAGSSRERGAALEIDARSHDLGGALEADRGGR